MVDRGKDSPSFYLILFLEQTTVSKTTTKKIDLETELRDAWEGEGNSDRITFDEWLDAMADNDRGTLQDAAKKLRRKRSGPKTHTPGPWMFGPVKEWTEKNGAARLKDGKGWFIGPEGRGLDIAHVHLTSSQDAGTQEANARLMTASPDLLTALQGIINAYNANPEPIHYKISAAINAARDSVTKAIDGGTE